ncbi:Bgt-20147, partial [Blumeria graminis f. sp. tritici]
DEVRNSRDWLMCDTLSAATQVVQATSKFLEAKAEAEKETTRFRKLDILERLEQVILPQPEYDAYRVSLGKPKQQIPSPYNSANSRAVRPTPPPQQALPEHKFPAQYNIAQVPLRNQETIPELSPKGQQLPDPRTSRHPLINGQRVYNGE